MRLRVAIFIFLTLIFSIAPSSAQSPPSPRFLQRVAAAGWQEAVPDEGERLAWTRGEARLVARDWEPEMTGDRWRLGAEEARVTNVDGVATLGMARGEAIEIRNVPDPEQELLAMASSLSSDGTVWRTVGNSVQGRPIEVVQMGTGENKTLFFGVFHGDEQAGDLVLRRLVQYLGKTPDVLEGRSVLVCPVLNPDGLAANTRVNANRVDVNRNFPAANWDGEGRGTRYWGGPEAGSEPETKIVIELLEGFQPAKIVTLHATLHNVNYDGPAGKLAKRMSALNGYVVEPDIGYPTPGSFGSYVGRERRIPTITLEFPEGGGEAMWLENKEALLEAIRYDVAD